MNEAQNLGGLSKESVVSELAALDFVVPEIPWSYGQFVIKNANKDVVFNGTPVHIDIENRSSLDVHGWIMLTVSVLISDALHRQFAKLTVRVEEDQDGDSWATTKVENKDRKMFGLGRVLWEKAMGIIQQSADKLGVPVEHVVQKYPREGLAPAKWDELFLPLLSKHSYKQVDEQKWKKIYEPQKDIRK